MGQKYSKQTQCVHSGRYIDNVTDGVNTPIYTSTSFVYIDMEQHSYPRYFNIPNQKAVADKLATLEHSEAGLVFSSGMAAITTTIYSLLSKGEHAVFQRGLYGGTHRFVVTKMKNFGMSYSFTKGISVSDFEREINANTKVIYIESPSNPLLEIVDLRLISELARSKNIITIIDNTFASPINQNPIDFGIDVVIHSGTKYLGGHSDICCGAVLTSNKIMERIYSGAIMYGGSLDTRICYLLERSLKTLALRVSQQNQNALSIARYLFRNEKVCDVYYPGLIHHNNHKVAKEQMSGYGGMVSFTLKDGKTAVNKFLKRLKLIKPAMSLGGVESIICSPAETSHSNLKKSERKALGITDDLLRLSVGIEDSNDLIEDIDMALT